LTDDTTDTPPPDEVIGMVGHELRSPLTSVLGYAQLLGAQELTDEQRRFVDVIERNGRRLLRTINELLVSVELSAGEFDLARQRGGWRHVDLPRLARGRSDELDPAYRAAGVSLTVMASGPVSVPGDPELLAQAFDSLLGHALRSTPRGGAVTMWAGLRDGAVRDAVIEVTATGAGMGQDELGRLTERRQADGEGGRHAFGVGLGLPVVRAIVDAHGGALDVDSAPGEGSRVTVTLPAGPWPPPTSAGARPPAIRAAE
jgi:signal transduction histidine kinase